MPLADRVPGQRENWDVDAAYREDTRVLVASRFPAAVAIFLALMGIAYSIEWFHFPDRWAKLSACYLSFIAIAVVATAALRRWPHRTIGIAWTASIAITYALAAYLALVQQSAELTLLAMIGFLTGVVVQFPWGPRGQIVATIGALTAYLWALEVGVRSSLPTSYGLFALCSHALMTVIGAQLLEEYRYAAFREAAESARHAEESERANAAKSEFLATVSHELRTPLNIIVGYTDLILEGAFDQRADEIDALRRVQGQSRQLLTLIQSMLDLNRMEAGEVSLVMEEFALGTALENLRVNLPPSWCKPDVRLTWEGNDDGITMRSDRGKLETILRNLIHNALKYTDRGSVTVRTHADRALGRVDFAIIDTGQGIAAAEMSVIFEMFRQGTGPPRGGGVGLGLYIVKRLTDALGGEIAVASAPGDGTRFTVSLPLGAPGPTAVS
jgi:signal transduction histidine kinase